MIYSDDPMASGDKGMLNDGARGSKQLLQMPFFRGQWLPLRLWA